MQQKSKKETAALEQTDAKELREQLQLLLRQVMELEEHADQDGESLPTSYAQALIILLDFNAQDKRPTLTDLVELLNIDKSNVTRLCQKMKRAGHIDVARDPRDRRAKRIELSQEGLELAEFVNSASLERFGAVIDEFDEDERHLILEWLNRLNQIIDEVH